jgi:hypothetical protein
VKAAVPAAKAGDGRAMWYIGQMLHMCMRAFNDIRGGTPLSFEAQLQQDLAQMHPNMPQYLKDEHERGARRCFPLFELGKKENPWAARRKCPSSGWRKPSRRAIRSHRWMLPPGRLPTSWQMRRCLRMLEPPR